MAKVNTILYLTMGTLGDATDFGDLLTAPTSPAGTMSATRGLFFGGNIGGGNYPATIQYFAMDTLGNATDFGDSTHDGRSDLASCTNGTYGVWMGGYKAGPTKNFIDYITIDTTGDSTDFGDLTGSVNNAMGLSNMHGGIS